MQAGAECVGYYTDAEHLLDKFTQRFPDVPRFKEKARLLEDPSISLINYQILGPSYRAITRWFFESGVTPEEVEMCWPALPEKFQVELRRALKKRDGLTRLLG